MLFKQNNGCRVFAFPLRSKIAVSIREVVESSPRCGFRQVWLCLALPEVVANPGFNPAGHKSDIAYDELNRSGLEQTGDVNPRERPATCCARECALPPQLLEGQMRHDPEGGVHRNLAIARVTVATWRL